MGTVEGPYQRIRSTVHVEFRVRVSDLVNATRLLTVNQGRNKASDVGQVVADGEPDTGPYLPLITI
jgi:hypothetical protein